MFCELLAGEMHKSCPKGHTAHETPATAVDTQSCILGV